MTLLAPGVKAPNFTLNSTPDQKISLSDFKGHPVILVFYPADWSPLCTNQLSLYNEILPEFQKHHAKIAGISVDGPWCHREFAENRKLHFPILSDFEPKGEVSKAYGTYNKLSGKSERSLFLIDQNGIIYWNYLSPVGVNPGAEGILNALEELQKSQVE